MIFGESVFIRVSGESRLWPITNRGSYGLLLQRAGSFNLIFKLVHCVALELSPVT
jgi:hypothetical protein